ncbi:putative toxin-antitoxin system toxin component, PIN family [Larkinella sp.]|uniref:putative toxin-antitoxin system toxin component, PIN family n=1 Tax=Larkinella sp. TaxID=2034517 RepID=UPI003BAD27BA
MAIVVFDTNILISAALLPESLPRKALNKAILHHTLVCSDVCFNELSTVLPRPKFRKYITEGEVSLFLVAFAQQAKWTDITCTITDCRDPKDNKFLELAVSANAAYLVTGDADLLILHPYQAIQIITLADFLAQI